MKNILQPFADLVTNLNKKNSFLKARIKLTLFYILGLSIILIILSIAIYWAFSQKVGIHNLFQNDVNFGEHLAREGYDGNELIHELKEKLLNIIIWVDILVILISSFFAYLFAKKTLAPIEKTFQKHKQFSSDIAHELRTPLSVLKSGIEYTLIKERTPQEYIHLLKEQENEIDYIIDVSNNLLESLSIHNTQIKKEYTNVSEICEKQVSLMHEYFKQKDIHFKKNIKKDIYAEIDSVKLKRVLYNLIKNAVEYNKKNGSIALSLSNNLHNIIITVEDTGIGIPQENIKDIFNQFYKVDTARTEHNNAGLGLYMVQEIVHAHKGMITCTSTIGKGSQFLIEIPKK